MTVSKENWVTLKKKKREGIKERKYFTVCTNGYRYDKRVFWAMFLLIGILFTMIAYEQNFNFSYRFYYNCVEPVCDNPFLDNPGYINSVTGYEYKCNELWCNYKYLQRGEYGTPPPWAMKNFEVIVFAFIVLGLGINHITYNQGKNLELTLNLPDKLKKKVKKIIEEVKND